MALGWPTNPAMTTGLGGAEMARITPARLAAAGTAAETSPTLLESLPRFRRHLAAENKSPPIEGYVEAVQRLHEYLTSAGMPVRVASITREHNRGLRGRPGSPAAPGECQDQVRIAPAVLALRGGPRRDHRVTDGPAEPPGRHRPVRGSRRPRATTGRPSDGQTWPSASSLRSGRPRYPTTGKAGDERRGDRTLGLASRRTQSSLSPFGT